MVPNRHHPDNLESVAADHLHAKIRVLLRVERKLEGGCFLFMDVFRPLPYLGGLLNRMVIKAIAASLFIRDVKKKREALGRAMSLLWN